MNWVKDYINDKKKKANYLINNKINWRKDQGGHLNLRVKNVDNTTFKFKTSIRGNNFVLKLYDMPRYDTYNGVWACITKKQALILARELLIYAGEKND